MGNAVSDFADELLHRISNAREALLLARETGEFYAARIYSGELDSLYRLANENGIAIPPQNSAPAEPVPTEQG